MFRLIPKTETTVEIVVNQEKVALVHFDQEGATEGSISHVQLAEIEVAPNQIGKGYSKEVLTYLAKSATYSKAGALIWKAKTAREFFLQIGAVAPFYLSDADTDTRHSA